MIFTQKEFLMLSPLSCVDRSGVCRIQNGQKVGLCSEAAQRAVIFVRHADFLYVEGYYRQPEGDGIPHAWNVFGDLIVDLEGVQPNYFVAHRSEADRYEPLETYNWSQVANHRRKLVTSAVTWMREEFRTTV
jgi:hypothetical protein